MHDSHAHIIADNFERYPPANPADPTIAAILREPFTADRLLAQMDAASVGKALVVQRGQVYGFDNSYVIAAAAQSGGRLKAVCGIDAGKADCGNELARLHAQGAAGFRLMAPFGDKSLDWLDGPAAAAFWAAAAAAGAPVCVHFFNWNRQDGLDRLDALLETYPIADLVIDHLTNGPIENVDQCGIDAGVLRLSERHNVSLKFTAIPLNALAERGIDAGAVLAAYLAIFGPERLLWGSDVTQSKGTYAQIVATGRSAVASFPEPIQTKLLQSNTARIYGL
jgi:predicted TIM-barrel fold metal-dependent hydrolase